MSSPEARCVVDASALVLLVQTSEADARSDIAHRVIPAFAESHGLTAPALLAWELAQVIHRKRATSWRRLDERTRVVRLLLEGIVMTAPEPRRIARTGEIAESHALSVYDAAYLELAESEDALLLTEDATLAKAATRLLGADRALDLAAASALVESA